MELKALHRPGWTVSALAREFGTCRATVRRELRRDGPAQYTRDKPTELTPAQLAHVERRLAACATIRGTDLHHELAEQYAFSGSYVSFQRQLRLLRPAAATALSKQLPGSCSPTNMTITAPASDAPTRA
jgi:IS30 family transposase